MPGLIEILNGALFIAGVTVGLSVLFLLVARLLKTPFHFWTAGTVALVMAACCYQTWYYWPRAAHADKLLFVDSANALVLIVLSSLCGTYLGRAFRMPDHAWRIGLILGTLTISAYLTAALWPPKLGVDLSGGTILVYEVDQSQKLPNQVVDMNELIAAVIRRVNPGGQKEVTIRTYGPEQIEIVIPEVSNQDEIAQIEDIIGRAGTLEFRILANNRDHAALIERAKLEPGRDVKDSAGNLVGKWVPVEKTRDRELSYPEIARRVQRVHNEDETQILVYMDLFNVTGQYLRRAASDIDQRTGKPCVTFMFDSEGGQLFSHLTSSNLPDKVQEFTRKLGIILDGKLYSAPSIQSTISDRGEITGDFTDAQVTSLVNVLNAGKLPAALNKQPISRLVTGPTLGLDTIHKSTVAMLIASILVPLFMLWYYRFAGVVADVALVLNMLMLLALMMVIKARFTLPGLAGLALTVGMAVDNNVLVFERLREELQRGATLRMAIRNAFQRAGATIIDCNLTHLLASTVLYVIGTEQVKGFAVTLWLGCAISMFTAVFVARVIFEIAEKRQWITELKMLHVIRHTNIDFMGWFRVCATASIFVTVAGLAIAGMRAHGRGLFDIDFTGGVSVQAYFRQPKDIDDVRQKLAHLPDVAVTNVRLGEEVEGRRFEISTSEPEGLKKVQQELKSIFGQDLMTNSLALGPMSVVVPEKPAAEPSPALTPPPAGKPPVEQIRAPAPTPGTAKPAEKPAEKSAAEKMPAEKPAEKPAAEKTPAAKPAEPDDKQASPDKPAKSDKKEKKDKKKTSADQPDKKDQSRGDLPADNVLALADADALPLVLAQAKTSEAPAAKPAEKGVGAAASTPAAMESKAAPAAPAKPAPAKAEEKPPVKPQEKAPAQPAAAAVAGDGSLVGGTQTQLTFEQPVNHQSVTDLIAWGLEVTKVAPPTTTYDVTNPAYTEGSSQSYQKWDVKVQLPAEKAKILFDAVAKHLADVPYFPASSEIGGAVAEGTRVQAIYALIASWMLIILYLWIRFQRVAFGLAAVIALVHDVLVMLAAVAASYWLALIPGMSTYLFIDPFKINLPIVAAFLTIIGYSVNDTIVVFDRIREVRGKDPNLTRKMVNDSTNQTLSRTLLTSFTVFLVVIVMYFFGGQALRGFSFALIVGVATGTYSSIYVAAPILLWMIGSPGHRFDEVSAESAKG